MINNLPKHNSVFSASFKNTKFGKLVIGSQNRDKACDTFR